MRSRRDHRLACRTVPHMWPLWHAWQKAERDLAWAQHVREKALQEWLEFSGQT